MWQIHDSYIEPECCNSHSKGTTFTFLILKFSSSFTSMISCKHKSTLLRLQQEPWLCLAACSQFYLGCAYRQCMLNQWGLNTIAIVLSYNQVETKMYFTCTGWYAHWTARVQPDVNWVGRWICVWFLYRLNYSVL